MCDECDGIPRDPGSTRERIDRFGYTTVGVGAGDGEPTFTYTVGLTERGHPELAMFGLVPANAYALLQPLAERIVHEGQRFRHGDVTRRPDLPIPLHFLEMSAAAVDGHLFEALDTYPDHAVAGLQVVWPDENGRLPWESGFRYLADQPVFGDPTVPIASG